MRSRFLPFAITGLVILAAVLGLAGIDLVLPAIPMMPELFQTTSTATQYVLAAYVGGTIFGLITFGTIATKYPPFKLLFFGLLGYGVTSLAATQATSIETLLAIRLAQGFTSIGPAVLAPGIIRSLFSDAGALRMLGFMGSIESLSPALAPIAGAALLPFGWTSSFWVTGGLALLLAIVMVPFALKGGSAALQRERVGGTVSYWQLLTHRPFLRMAGCQAMLLGGLLVFVFAAPAVIVRSMNGALSDFILMQVVGVTSYIIASNSTGFLSERVGRERMLQLGTGLGFLSAGGLTLFAVLGGSNPSLLVPLFLPLNVGLGLAGPVAFLGAVEAGLGDDARASALIFLLITGTSAGFTALVAPFIDKGLIAPASATLFALTLCLVSLHGLKVRSV